MSFAETDPLYLDRDRRLVLDHLKHWLSELVEGTEAVSAAALQADRDAFVRARTSLLHLLDAPAPDLMRITEIYNALRLAIVDRRLAPLGPRSFADGSDPKGSHAPGGELHRGQSAT